MKFLTIFSIFALSLFISIRVLPALVNHQPDRTLSHVEAEVHQTVKNNDLKNEVKDDAEKYNENQQIYHQHQDSHIHEKRPGYYEGDSRIQEEGPGYYEDDSYIHEEGPGYYEDNSRLPQQDNPRLQQEELLPDQDELRIHQKDSRVYDRESNIYERESNFRGSYDYRRNLDLYEADYNRGSMKDKIQDRKHFQRENIEDR